MLIDIHTHHDPLTLKAHYCFKVGLHSLGIHPWSLVAPFEIEIYEKKWRELEANAKRPLLAIGECGLDRAREAIAGIEVQLKVLEWHLDWAQKLKRPVIIHCVKAHSDLLWLLKERPFRGALLLHDFSGNQTQAQAFVKFGCFFSFGRRLFNQHSKAIEVLKSIPRDRIFFETDDQQEVDIEAVYRKAQEILGIDSEELEALVEKNLTAFFSDLDDISPADVINDLRFPRIL